jgi:hypothetical protein
MARNQNLTKCDYVRFLSRILSNLFQYQIVVLLIFNNFEKDIVQNKQNDILFSGPGKRDFWNRCRSVTRTKPHFRYQYSIDWVGYSQSRTSLGMWQSINRSLMTSDIFLTLPSICNSVMKWSCFVVVTTFS